MTSPIDAVVAIHNAFRHDMRLIDTAARDAARGKPGLGATVERFRFFNEVLESRRRWPRPTRKTIGPWMPRS
jgi:hypothetical protein